MRLSVDLVCVCEREYTYIELNLIDLLLIGKVLCCKCIFTQEKKLKKKLTKPDRPSAHSQSALLQVYLHSELAPVPANQLLLNSVKRDLV